MRARWIWGNTAKNGNKKQERNKKNKKCNQQKAGGLKSLVDLSNACIRALELRLDELDAFLDVASRLAVHHGQAVDEFGRDLCE